MSLTGRIKTIKVMAPKVRSIMGQIPASDWTGNEDLECWILLVGYASAQQDSEVSDWFFEHLCSSEYLQSLPYIVRRDDALVEILERLQRKFFFHAPVQKPLTHDLVRRISSSPTMMLR